MTSYKRAMLLVTSSSMVVPLIGIVTAPILAHSLGVTGRGEVSAALAPNLLLVGGATLGLPQAVTYFIAKNLTGFRKPLLVAALLVIPLPLIALSIIYLFGGVLSKGDESLQQLMLLGAVLAIPALLVAVLRGAAMALERWSAVALEKVATSVLRLCGLASLAFVGLLTPVTALVVIALSPVLSGVVYLSATKKLLLGSSAERERRSGDPSSLKVGVALFSFGARIWLGSVAVILLARTTDLLMTPLSNVSQLGLLAVAVTIADTPYVVTQAIYGVVFSSNSSNSNLEQITATARITILLAALGGILVGATIPFWIEVAFGPGFAGSVVPTWLLLMASCIAVPGIIGGAAIDSHGRPGVRSTCLAFALIVNVIGLVALVPSYGALGGATAGLLSTTFSSIMIVAMASRIHRCSARDFVVPRAEDLRRIVVIAKECTALVSRGKNRSVAEGHDFS